jgi:hypothetical protein
MDGRLGRTWAAPGPHLGRTWAGPGPDLGRTWARPATDARNGPKNGRKNGHKNGHWAPAGKAAWDPARLRTTS